MFSATTENLLRPSTNLDRPLLFETILVSIAAHRALLV